MQEKVLDWITEQMVETEDLLLGHLPPSRERSLALTKLEEVSMWAKKACVLTVGIEPDPRVDLIIAPTEAAGNHRRSQLNIGKSNALIVTPRSIERLRGMGKDAIAKVHIVSGISAEDFAPIEFALDIIGVNWA